MLNTVVNDYSCSCHLKLSFCCHLIGFNLQQFAVRSSWSQLIFNTSEKIGITSIWCNHIQNFWFKCLMTLKYITNELILKSELNLLRYIQHNWNTACIFILSLSLYFILSLKLFLAYFWQQRVTYNIICKMSHCQSLGKQHLSQQREDNVFVQWLSVRNILHAFPQRVDLNHFT